MSTIKEVINETEKDEYARRMMEMQMNAYRSLPMTPELSQAIKEKLDAAKAKERQEGGAHYKEMKVQPWDVIDTWPIEQQIGYHRGNVLKYTMRLGNKDGRLQEAKKIRHYADKLIEVLERT